MPTAPSLRTKRVLPDWMMAIVAKKKRLTKKKTTKKKTETTKTTTKKTKAQDNAIPMIDPPHIFDKDSNIDDIVAAYRRDGYFVYRVLDHANNADHRAQRIAIMKEMVKEVLLKQPWKEQVIVHDRETGEVLDIDADTERYLEALTAPCVPPKELKQWEDTWPFHRGFGAPCDPSCFNLSEVWKIRQDPRLYEIASAVLGRHKAYVDINRIILVLPGQGDPEFAHYDCFAFGNDNWDLKSKQLQGKMCITNGVLKCAPRTATEAFHSDFKDNYREHYPNAKSTDAKMTIDPLKPDPLNLIARCVSINVPAGCYIGWNEHLLHGVCKNPRKDGHLKVGFYLGYKTDIDSIDYLAMTGDEERDDRIHSYTYGVAPKLWPSLDPIHYYPYRFINFPHLLEGYIAKCRDDWPGLTTRVIQSGPKKGTVVRDIVPVPDPHYVPPTLTPLGRALLGIDPWPARV